MMSLDLALSPCSVALERAQTAETQSRPWAGGTTPLETRWLGTGVVLKSGPVIPLSMSVSNSTRRVIWDHGLFSPLKADGESPSPVWASRVLISTNDTLANGLPMIVLLGKFVVLYNQLNAEQRRFCPGCIGSSPESVAKVTAATLAREISVRQQ